jgi:hypothetical protein
MPRNRVWTIRILFFNEYAFTVILTKNGGNSGPNSSRKRKTLEISFRTLYASEKRSEFRFEPHRRENARISISLTEIFPNRSRRRILLQKKRETQVNEIIVRVHSDLCSGRESVVKAIRVPLKGHGSVLEVVNVM